MENNVFAGLLIGIGAVEVTGKEVSVNFNKIYLYPPLWKRIQESLLSQINVEEVSIIVGAREDACLWAFWLCDKTGKKMGKYTSGRLEIVKKKDWRGQRVVIVDDFMMTGQTVKAAIEDLQAAGAEVASVVTIINCSSIDNFGNIPVFAATTASEIIKENERLKASE